MEKGKIIVVSAPSGAGKTTLLDHLRAQIPDLLYSISATTRAPRPGEMNGVHYYFHSREEFSMMIDAGAFAEWQEVHGNYYGTPRKFVEETVAAGRTIVMDIDVYGKKKFDAVFPDSIGIFIAPPSIDELELRLRGRKTESEKALRLRITNARDEMEFARARGKYEFTIVNEDLEQAKKELVDIVRRTIGR